jgi:lipocalin
MKMIAANSIRVVSLSVLCVSGSLFNSCQSTSPVPFSKPLPPLKAMNQPVKLDRFMGDWHVIACIPTFIETEAYNAMESYKLDQDGTIATTFTFNKGLFRKICGSNRKLTVAERRSSS